MKLNYTVRLCYYALLVLFFGLLLAVAVMDHDDLGVLMSLGGVAIGVMGAIDTSYHHNVNILLKFQRDSAEHRADLAEREVASIKWKLNPEHYRRPNT